MGDIGPVLFEDRIGKVAGFEVELLSLVDAMVDARCMCVKGAWLRAFRSFADQSE
jgi:hypothetical protein